MKKKILALVLVVVLAITAITGATLAYFTDVATDVNNNFTIGNIDIELEEATGIFDEKGGELVKQVVTEDGVTSYDGVMPTQYLEKTAVIKNTGANEAYVRVFITMNNHEAINNALDEVYEAEGEDVIQAVYDDVFDGFNIMHNKDASHFDKDSLRGWMNKTIGEVTTGVELLAIDYVRIPDATANYQHVKNTFMNADFEATNDSCDISSDLPAGYYKDAVEADSRTWVLYFKMDANTSYTLFNGLNVPADFTADQLAMFDGLKIGIYADAIQTVGFYDTIIAGTDDYTEAWVNAINALEDAHHMGWWN